MGKSRAGSGGSNCQEVLIPNTTRPPFDDLEVRRAFYRALDRDALLESIYLGLGRVATGPISHELAWAYTEDVRRYPHAPDEANRRLDDAGFPRGPDGHRFTVTFTHASRFSGLAEAMRAQLREVGIVLELESLELNRAVEKVFVDKDFDLGYASFCNGIDPDIGVRRVYVSSNIAPVPFSNGAGYRNPRIDELFDRAVRPAEQDERAELYHEIQRALVEDVPYLWLVDSEFYRAHRSSWTRFRLWTGGFAETVRRSEMAHMDRNLSRSSQRSVGARRFNSSNQLETTFSRSVVSFPGPRYLKSKNLSPSGKHADVASVDGFLLVPTERGSRTVIVDHVDITFVEIPGVDDHAPVRCPRPTVHVPDTVSERDLLG